MMDLLEPWNWVTMLLVAAALGAFGGLAYELLHRGRRTNEHLQQFAMLLTHLDPQRKVLII